MSTKTSIKRIAAVAAVALTLGGFSAVSANAAITYAAATPFSVSVADSGVTGSSATVGATLTAGQIAGPSNYVRIVAGSDIAASSTLKVSTAGSGSSLAADGTSSPSTLTDNSSTGVKATEVYSADNNLYTDGTHYAAVKIFTPTVGTVTVTIAKSVDNGNGTFTVTTLQTLTITVSAASVVGTLSVANSTSFISDSSTVYANIGSIQGASLTVDATVLAAKGTGAVGAIQVTLKDTQTTPAVLAGGKVLSASVSGSGLITGTGSTDDSALGSSPARVATSTTNSTSGIAGFKVYGDGTAGVGTITITYTDANGVTSTVATETVTFYGAASALTATQNLNVASTAGATL